MRGANPPEAIARDMAMIFMGAHTAPPLRSPHVRAVVPRRSPVHRRSRRLLATVAAVAVLGTGAGLLFVAHGLRDAEPVSLPVPHTESASADASRPTATAPKDRNVSAPRLAYSEDIVPKQAKHAAAGLPASPSEKPSRHDSRLRDATRSADVGRAPKTASSKCLRSDPASRAWCLRPNVLDAEAKLRLAYVGATHAGSDRDVLARYQRRWSALNRNANTDPDATIKGYRVLQQELEELVSSEHSARSRRERWK